MPNLLLYCPVCILICVRLNLSVHSLSHYIALYHAISPFPTASRLAQCLCFYNITEKVLIPDNLPKPSMLPVSSCIQYGPNSVAHTTYLIACHALCRTDFQHPQPCPHFIRFQWFLGCIALGVQRPIVVNFPVDDLSVRTYVRRSVCLSNALCQNGGSDLDAVWHHRSDGSRDEAVSGVWGSVHGKEYFWGRFWGASL